MKTIKIIVPKGYKVITAEAATTAINPAKAASAAAKGMEKIQDKINKEQEKQAILTTQREKDTDARLKKIELALQQQQQQKPGMPPKPGTPQPNIAQQKQQQQQQQKAVAQTIKRNPQAAAVAISNIGKALGI